MEASRILATVETTGVGQAERELAGFGTSVDRVGGMAGKVLGGLVVAGAAAGGLAIGAFAASSVSAAASFEKSLSSIAAVSGATAGEMEQISALSLQLGADTAFSAGEAAAGLEELIKGGLSIADAMAAANPMLDLAAAGGIEVGAAAEIAANAIGIFSLKGSDMTNVANQIAGAANASSLSVSDFQFSMAAAGSVAAGVGQNFDSMATAIAVMGTAGIKGSDAGTSLKTMLMNLQPTTAAQIGQFKELGILTLDNAKAITTLGLAQNASSAEVGNAIDAWALQSSTLDNLTVGTAAYDKQFTKLVDGFEASHASNAFINANGSFKSMAEIAEVLQTSTSGLTDAQRALALETMFGSDAIRAANIFVKEGAEGFDAMASSMGKVTAESVAATKLDNFSGAIDAMKGSIETFQIIVGTALLPMLTSLVNDHLTPLINKAAAFSTAFFDAGDKMGFLVGKINELLPGFAAFVTFITGTAIPALQSIGATVADNIQPIMAGLSTLLVTVVVPAFAAWAAGAIAAAGATVVALAPVLLPLAAIALAVGALKLAWDTNFGGIQQKTAAFSSWFNSTAVPAMDAGNKAMAAQATVMRAAWDRDWAALQTKVGAVQSWWSGTAVPAISAGLVITVTKVAEMRTAWDTAFAAVRGFIDTLQTAWNTAVVGIGVAVGTAIGHVISFRETVSTRIGEVVTFFQQLPGKITAALGNLGTLLVQAGKDVINGMIAGVTSVAGTLATAAAKVVTDALDAAKSAIGIRSPSKRFRDEVGVPMIQGTIEGVHASAGRLAEETKAAHLTALVGAIDTIKGARPEQHRAVAAIVTDSITEWQRLRSEQWRIMEEAMTGTADRVKGARPRMNAAVDEALIDVPARMGAILPRMHAVTDEVMSGTADRIKGARSRMNAATDEALVDVPTRMGAILPRMHAVADTVMDGTAARMGAARPRMNAAVDTALADVPKRMEAGMKAPMDDAYHHGSAVGDRYGAGIADAISRISIPNVFGGGGQGGSAGGSHRLPGSMPDYFSGYPTDSPFIPTAPVTDGSRPNLPSGPIGRGGDKYGANTVIERQVVLNVSRPMNVENEMAGLDAWANAGR